MESKSKSVTEAAYELWCMRGHPLGSAEIDWFEAERLLNAHGAETSATLDDKLDQADAGSFPASDPPASHIPDRVPSNAAAKRQTSAAEQESAGPSKERRINQK